MLQCRSSYSLSPIACGMWQAGGKARKLAQCVMDKRVRVFRDFGHKRASARSALECGSLLPLSPGRKLASGTTSSKLKTKKRQQAAALQSQLLVDAVAQALSGEAGKNSSKLNE